ncbi:hypothetical protein CWI42_100550 [Ordospora colligata]|uniref:Uncharacterized protein n=1 Tax=Ordospora colligata OC4 TaxID=1354746 RepID=A0A0B2UJ39_9MICR|nr:uncharacterized protein M896_100560 [Ordospora colligata OC4]KHN69072.1 hypothetical protein M896_100560 [Ordospora colligata OC4]TBU14353.1 hypothetical protein CWI40_100570 [Ordospora colligata]TBU14418.1 hypothetical protein CWI41_100570 [Ordospora colligata]TBU17934.1 hypothetical protein CWI42_100550 [Ordospora colligata]
MFDSEYFKNLLNETTALISNKTEGTYSDDVEIQIESNIMALKHLANEISDKEVQSKMLKRIDMLCAEPAEFEVSEVHQRITGVNKSNEYSDRIEKDILKYSRQLHGKAKKFLDSVRLDGNVLDEVTDKMTKNLAGTSSALRFMKTEQSSNISVFRILISALVIFVIMYFIIRFL